MHIWIDIDRVECVAFTKAIVDELNKRGHKVTITAQNSKDIKNQLNKHNLNAKVIGFVFSMFGIFLKPLNMLRSFKLEDYIKSRNIDVSFSMGSTPMLYTCFSNKMLIILFLENKNQKVNKWHFIFDKICFIISDASFEEFLLEKGYELKYMQRYNRHSEPFCDNPSQILVKEIADKIEYLATSHNLIA